MHRAFRMLIHKLYIGGCLASGPQNPVTIGLEIKCGHEARYYGCWAHFRGQTFSLLSETGPDGAFGIGIH